MSEISDCKTHQGPVRCLHCVLAKDINNALLKSQWPLWHSDVRVRLKACDPAQPSPTRPWKARPSYWVLAGSRLGCQLGKAQALGFQPSGPVITVSIEQHLISCDLVPCQLISDHSFVLDSHVHVASAFNLLLFKMIMILCQDYTFIYNLLFCCANLCFWAPLSYYNVLWPPETDNLEVEICHKWPSTSRKVGNMIKSNIRYILLIQFYLLGSFSPSEGKR